MRALWVRVRGGALLASPRRCSTADCLPSLLPPPLAPRCRTRPYPFLRYLQLWVRADRVQKHTRGRARCMLAHACAPGQCSVSALSCMGGCERDCPHFISAFLTPSETPAQRLRPRRRRRLRRLRSRRLRPRRLRPRRLRRRRLRPRGRVRRLWRVSPESGQAGLPGAASSHCIHMCKCGRAALCEWLPRGWSTALVPMRSRAFKLTPRRAPCSRPAPAAAAAATEAMAGEGARR